MMAVKARNDCKSLLLGYWRHKKQLDVNCSLLNGALTHMLRISVRMWIMFDLRFLWLAFLKYRMALRKERVFESRNIWRIFTQKYSLTCGENERRVHIFNVSISMRIRLRASLECSPGQLIIDARLNYYLKICFYFNYNFSLHISPREL